MTAFDARSAARRLIGGMPVQAFDATVREQRPHLFVAAFDAARLEQLFGLARMEALFASDTLPLDHVDLYEDGHLKRLADLQKKSGKTGLAVIAERFSEGVTIRLRDVDTFDARLSGFVAEVRRQFAAQSQINVYLTPPGKAGFPPHFDITDVFIVQVLGAKHWRVFDDYTSRVELPVLATNWEPEKFRPIGMPPAMTLSAGDVLYLPRGVMHEAFCADRASLHLTISITPMTFADLLARELQRVARTSVAFRRRVPWSADGDTPDETARIAVAAQDCLRELLAQVNVADVVAEERVAIQEAPRSDGAAVNLAATIGSAFATAPPSMDAHPADGQPARA